MKVCYLTLLVLAISVPSVRGQIDTLPDTVILVSQVSDVKMLDDSTMIGLIENGLALFQYDASISKFVFQSRIYFKVASGSLKICDSVIVVKSNDDRLHFVERRDGYLRYLGKVYFNFPVADFALRGEEIYVAAYFDGIRRYLLKRWNMLLYADLNMVGILVTQLEIKGDHLFALDEYNGILRYDISGDGFGEFIDYFYVPLRVKRFAASDDVWCLLLNTQKAYLADYSSGIGQIKDSVIGIETPYAAHIAEEHIVISGSRTTYLVNKLDAAIEREIETPLRFGGDLATVGGAQHLMLPGSLGGVTMLNLEQDTEPFEGLSRSGVIEDILIYENHLVVAAASNPVDVFAIAEDQRVSYDFSLLPERVGASYITRRADSLLALYPSTNRVVVFPQFLDQDTAFFGSSFILQPLSFTDIRFLAGLLHGYGVFLTIGNYQINAYTIDDSSTISPPVTWSVTSGIDGYETVDTFLYVATSKAYLQLYRIQSDFNIDYLSELGISGRASKIARYDEEHLALFTWNYKMYCINISQPPFLGIEAVINLPKVVEDAAVENDRLYAVGPQGMLAFEIKNGLPYLYAEGGVAGEVIAADSDRLAVSDGNGISLFKIPQPAAPAAPDDSVEAPASLLAQNFPNPFNLGTTIVYRLPSEAQVELEIINLLGQTVTTLVDERKEAGVYEVAWNGRDKNGALVASGLYFYRIRCEHASQTKKMVLLK